VNSLGRSLGDARDVRTTADHTSGYAGAAIAATREWQVVHLQKRSSVSVPDPDRNTKRAAAVTLDAIPRGSGEAGVSAGGDDTPARDEQRQ
jgi:hypothetical protein